MSVIDSNSQDMHGELDRTAAYRCVTAWAHFERDDISDITTDADGDFYGSLGSISFDYSAKNKLLAVRAAAQPYARRLSKRSDILAELHQIEIDDPKSVAYARFELVSGRWQRDHSEPWLYLRLDITTGSQSSDDFVKRLKILGDTAHLWFRIRLAEVTDRVNKRDRQQKYAQ